VPCGSGPSVVLAAQGVGSSGHVVGIDFAEQMVAIAREKADDAGLDNVTLSVADMTTLDASQFEPFDAVVCSLGLFFAEDMTGLLRSLVRLIRPDDRLPLRSPL
jgi:ubiquinone/menaquinone biosynthesis C-methylase UbiE